MNTPNYTHINSFIIKESEQEEINQLIQVRGNKTSKKPCTCVDNCCGIEYGLFTCANRANYTPSMFCNDQTCAVFLRTRERTCGNYCLESHPSLILGATDKKGIGVFNSIRQIIAGEVLFLYTGEMKLSQTFRQQEDLLYEIGEESMYGADINAYRNSGSEGVVIDARYYGNHSRFINHSCWGNAQMYEWNLKNNFVIVMVAIDPIAPGDEVTFDYTDANTVPENFTCCECNHCIRIRETEEEEKENTSLRRLPFLKSMRYDDRGAPNTFGSYKDKTNIFLSFLTIFTTNNVGRKSKVLRGTLSQDNISSIFETLKAEFTKFRENRSHVPEKFRKSIIECLNYLILFLSGDLDYIGNGTVITRSCSGRA
jgi:hypothetical protein